MAQPVTHEVLHEADDEVIFKMPIGRRRTTRRPHTLKNPEITVFDENIQSQGSSPAGTFMSPLQSRDGNIVPVSAGNKPSARRQLSTPLNAQATPRATVDTGKTEDVYRPASSRTATPSTAVSAASRSSRGTPVQVNVQSIKATPPPVDPATARHLPRHSDAQLEVACKQAALKAKREAEHTMRAKADGDKIALQDQLDIMTVEFESANARAERALAERTRFGQLLEKAESRIVALESGMGELAAQAEEATALAVQGADDTEALQATVAGLKTDNAQLTTQLAQAQISEKQLREQLESLQAKADAAATTSAEQTSDLQSQVAELQKRYDDKIAAVHRINDSFAGFQKRFTSIKTDLATAQAALEAATAENAQLQEAETNAADAEAAARSELVGVCAARDAATARVAALEAQLADAKAAADDSAAQLAETAAATAQLKSERDSAIVRAHDAEAAAAAATEAAQGATAGLQAAQAELAAAQGALDAKEAELAESLNTAEELMAMLEKGGEQEEGEPEEY